MLFLRLILSADIRDPTLSRIAFSNGWWTKRTVKPAEVAQTLLPSLLKMAALSRLPVPTRLEVGLSVMVLRIVAIMVCTSGRRMLLFQKSADKLAISMREERKGHTLPRHCCGCEDV
jgi:hypothetical protein